jgi:hypothetical protein
MSSRAFDGQKVDTSKRYYIDDLPDGEFGWRIIDRVTGEEVGRDGGEPEDQSLVRDWEWVVHALNAARAEGYKQGQEDEREACAAIADNFSGQSKWVGGTARAISKFIRARGEKKNK